jgi:hypothetical protein
VHELVAKLQPDLLNIRGTGCLKAQVRGRRPQPAPLLLTSV